MAQSSKDMTFDPGQWIGQGKKYPLQDVPEYISDAKGETLRVPATASLLLPSASLPVKDFISTNLPELSNDLVSFVPESWFSNDPPVTDVSTLLDRPVPPKALLIRLERVYGQAWFDGCQSLIDKRFNHGSERFPVWVIRFWGDIERMRVGQDRWRQSYQWLEDQLEKATRQGIELTQLERAKEMLVRLPWNERLDFEGGDVTTSLLFTGFLGTVWLSDDHINAMSFVLAEELEQKTPNSNIIVASLYFSFYVNRDGRNLKANNKQWPSRYLRRYQSAIKEKNIKKLYFPIHINDNHWIAAEVDFERRQVAYGDSYEGSRNIPEKFNRFILMWLKYAFDKKFSCAGRTLECAKQTDTYSCGIVTANTIEHHVFGTALWKQKKSAQGRVEWFIRLVKRQDDRLGRGSLSPGVDARNVAIGRRISDLLNPPDDEPMHIVTVDDSDESDSESVVYEGSDDDAGDETLPDPPSDVYGAPQSEPNETTQPVPPKPGAKSTKLKQSKLSFGTQAGVKRKVEVVAESSDDAEEPKNTKLRRGNGSSRSATKARELREKVKAGNHTPRTGSVTRFQAKLRDVDPDVEFDEAQPFKARCSKCRTWREGKEPGDATRIIQHLRQCKGDVQSLFAVWGKSQTDLTLTRASIEGQKTLVMHPRRSLCPGLTRHDDPRIPAHLKRSSVVGGGSRSLTAIAKDLYSESYAELPKKQKQVVLEVQEKEEKWVNQPRFNRVVSRSCADFVDAPLAPVDRLLPCKACMEVLKSKAFKNMLGKKSALTANLVYVNKRFQNPDYGALFLAHSGLRAMLENPKSNPFLSLAAKFAEGKMKKKTLFIGMAQSMVIAMSKEERGVGLQNFKYPLEYEEHCELIRDINPQAYESFSAQVPMPKQRTLRAKRSLKPQFPMQLCDKLFDRVKKELEDMGWTGPVALSCDDTKLLSAYRLFWDNEKESYYLVGAIEGPLKVLDAQQVKATIQEAKAQKATKVRLWCITIPSPKVTPIIVAALPIGEKNTAQQLQPWLQGIVDALIDRQIRLVSYASDGTEVERSLQRLFLQMGEPRQYIIKNPQTGRPDTVVKYSLYRGQAMCIIQDSKHALKTLRNNMYSGARLLVLGNHISAYRHIRQVADEPGSPIYRRDVENLDRQDDNAATRLFSSGFLRYLVDNHKHDSLGSIIFLFVFGELVDAYQSRTMTHGERVHLVLRARYFLDSWTAYLEVMGYPKAKYHVSREALDILDIVIQGLIALIVIHRDHMDGQRIPLVPWMNTTEPDEHVFGAARKIVPDFTYLDFIYMIPKLRVKIREAILNSHTTDSKAQASGYFHTWFDAAGLDIHTLSVFPTDVEINAIATKASGEADSLCLVLGWVSEQVYHRLNRSSARLTTLPTISSWVTANRIDNNYESEDSDDESERDDGLLDKDGRRVYERGGVPVEQDSAGLIGYRLAVQEQHAPGDRRKYIDDTMERMSYATMAVLTNDAMRVREFAADNNDDSTTTLQKEDTFHVSSMREYLLGHNLPSVATAVPEAEQPFGSGVSTLDTLDLDALVELRAQHESRHAATGLRTSSTAACRKSQSTKVTIKAEMEAALRQYESAKGIGTGLHRKENWRAPAPGGRDALVNGQAAPTLAAGNQENAEIVAAAAVKKVQAKRKETFTTVKLADDVLKLVIDAQVDSLRPLRIHDYGFVFIRSSLHVARVVALYSNGGGKNKRHEAKTDTSAIAGLSYIGVQVFEQRFGRLFSAIPEDTATLGTHRFDFIPHYNFVLRIPRNWTATLNNGNIELIQEGKTYFDKISNTAAKLDRAMKLFSKRSKGQNVDDGT